MEIPTRDVFAATRDPLFRRRLSLFDAGDISLVMSIMQLNKGAAPGRTGA
jgi:hypothetical protein